MKETTRTPKVLTEDEIRLTDLYIDIRFKFDKLNLTLPDIAALQSAFEECATLCMDGLIDAALQSEMRVRFYAMGVVFLANRRLLDSVALAEGATEQGTLTTEIIDNVGVQVFASSALGISHEALAPLFLRLERCLKRAGLEHPMLKLQLLNLRMTRVLPFE